MVKIDIEMPTYCYDCPCHNGENGRCNITGDTTFDKRPFDCPLKEVKLADLPSAQPDWIPCSEVTGDGYPEEEGIYYVTEQNYGFYLDDTSWKERVTHTSHFINGTFIDRVYSENYSNITAWMPLPEPYQSNIEEKADEQEIY